MSGGINFCSTARKKTLNNYPLVIYFMRSFKENKYNFCRISKVEQGIDIADKPQVKSHNKVMKSTFFSHIIMVKVKKDKK